MKKHFLKPIVGGIILGAFIYFVPKFLLPFFAIIIFAKMIFGRRKFAEQRLMMADKIRSMSDEEYTAFKSKVTTGPSCQSRFQSRCSSNSKTEAKQS